MVNPSKLIFLHEEGGLLIVGSPIPCPKKQLAENFFPLANLIRKRFSLLSSDRKCLKIKVWAKTLTKVECVKKSRIELSKFLQRWNATGIVNILGIQLREKTRCSLSGKNYLNFSKSKFRDNGDQTVLKTDEKLSTEFLLSVSKLKHQTTVDDFFGIRN